MSDSDKAGADLAFGVLGPLQASYAGAALALGGGRQRAVLALLVCEAGHAVPVERLLDGLWGESVPPGAVTSVQTYVFHLRQLLEPGRARGSPGSVLVTVPGG
jgi:DNA-binding SARP family transcriptional activator